MVGKQIFRKIKYLGLVIFLTSFQHCSETPKTNPKNSQQQQKFYSVADFKSVHKIDAHTHLRTRDSTYIMLAAANNFRLLDINVYSFTGTPI